MKERTILTGFLLLHLIIPLAQAAGEQFNKFGKFDEHKHRPWE